VITYVQRQFGDESGAQITTADIIRWINAAQLDLALKTEYSQTQATTPSVAGQTQYSLPGINILTLKAVYYNNVPLENKSFNEVQETVLSKIQPGNIVQGTPVMWYEWDDSIYLWPPPAASDETITLFCIVQPDLVTQASDSLSILDLYWQALLQWIMKEAYELDDDFNASTFKSKQLDGTLNEIGDRDFSQRYYPTITILDEDADV
jgi:hypothetical protein